MLMSILATKYVPIDPHDVSISQFVEKMENKLM